MTTPYLKKQETLRQIASDLETVAHPDNPYNHWIDAVIEAVQLMETDGALEEAIEQTNREWRKLDPDDIDYDFVEKLDGYYWVQFELGVSKKQGSES